MPFAIDDREGDVEIFCGVPNCIRGPVIPVRVLIGENWHDISLCVWHRMAQGRMNGFLFDEKGNLRHEYTVEYRDGLLTFPKRGDNG